MSSFIWFRNDLRLHGSKTLETASQSGQRSIPVYIIDPELINDPDISSSRIAFMAGSLIELKDQLKSLGSDLLIVNGSPLQFWEKMCTQNQISLLASKDYSNYAKNRDSSVQKIVSNNGGVFEAVKNSVVFDSSDQLLTLQQNPIHVFSAFKRTWLKKLSTDLSVLHTSYSLNNLFVTETEIASFCELNGVEIVSTEWLQDMAVLQTCMKGGEASAQAVWNRFKSAVLPQYATCRDFPDKEGTSQLSPHLKWGTISPYTIIQELISVLGSNFADSKQFVGTDKSGYETFLSELIWREFYKYILDYYPHSQHENYNPRYNSVVWENDETLFAAWCQGKTGFPIVDAFMRQLNTTHWMHNRGRMIVASFLCKDLHIDWRWGERYFKQQLIDYDVSANVGGWQWVAGTGTDAAPYFRIFNPVEQSKRFDPKGDFIKKYIPELGGFDRDQIHAPWLTSIIEQQAAHCQIGADYPAPIIDHIIERKRALKLYKAE
jgi:deoxyribodipyrimidine photo-lyase